MAQADKARTGKTLRPTRKVSAQGLGSGVLGMPLGVLLAGWLGLGPEAAAALGGVLTALFGFVAGWLVPERGA